MEIVRRAKQNFQFKAIKPFWKFGRKVEVGEELEFSEAEQTGYVRIGKIFPSDIPEVGIYIALKPFFLPGREMKFEAKAMDLVSLKAEDALRLMLEGAVIPKDDHRWRPNNRRLKRK